MPTAQALPGGAFAHGLDDLLGAAGSVGQPHHLVRALGMHDHLDAGVLLAHAGDVLRQEHLVNAATAVP